jgi:ribosomal protein S18 acetylase RimI-like enzyme
LERIVTTKIRLLLPDDPALPALATLMEEMQAYYQVPCPSPAEIVVMLKTIPQGAEILVVEENEIILGFAAFSGIYPGPGLKPGIFLKELFVSAAQRSRGFGRELMRALAALARERGLARIDWTADPENAKLLDFYDGLGGQRKPDKLFYRLDGKALEELAT